MNEEKLILVYYCAYRVAVCFKWKCFFQKCKFSILWKAVELFPLNLQEYNIAMGINNPVASYWSLADVLWCHQAESHRCVSCLSHPGTAENSVAIPSSKTGVLRHVLPSKPITTQVICWCPWVGLRSGPDTESTENLHELYHGLYCKEMLMCSICIVFEYQIMLICLECWNNSINPYELWSGNEMY